MATGADVALARISADAYLSFAQDLPAGFVPVSTAALGITTSSDAYNNGLYRDQNGAALVLVGTLNGKTTAVLAFRGSANEQDSINSLDNPDNEYSLYANLISAFDKFVAREGISQVAVTGHSLGGAMAQIYMSTHANTASVQYISDTFGSPGALISTDGDTRITNYQIADDPAVYLGQNRAAVGSELRSNPAEAGAAIFQSSQAFPGLTAADAANSLQYLNQNYVNNGTDVTLPAANGSTTPISSFSQAANADVSEHNITTYISRLEAATGSTGDDQTGPSITATTVGQPVFRFLDTTDGTHFYTASQTEVNQIEATRSDMRFEGVGLNADQPSNPNASAIYRFLDTDDGSHFYTANAGEKNQVVATRPDMIFEGTAFYADTTQQAGDVPVYRYLDTSDGSHFYSPNLNEVASVDATRPDLIPEGVAFYSSLS